MKRKIIQLLIIPLVLGSCGGHAYTSIFKGQGASPGISYNVKSIWEGCCGCNGILVNTFEDQRLVSQLFVESNCPFTWTKYKFNYSPNGTLAKLDTLIAVAYSSFEIPVSTTDMLALRKVDSFISTAPRGNRYLKNIAITGYRKKTTRDQLIMKGPSLQKEVLC